MAEQRENSVLFSLKELRNIEDDRVRQEEEAARQRAEEEKRALQESARLMKVEEERLIREERDRQERMQQEKERQIREEQLRLDEAERKAKIDAAARLEETRIKAEAEARAQLQGKKPPVAMILGSVATVLVLAGAALAYVFLVVIPQRDLEAAKRAEAAQAVAVKAAVAKMRASLEDEYNAKIAEAKDDAEKSRLIAEKAARQEQQEQEIRSRVKSVRAVASPGAKPSVKPIRRAVEPNCKDPTDPLCGSGL